MYSIGIIASEQSIQNIMKADHEFRRFCHVTYLPYSTMDHLLFLFQQNIDRFDAFLFGGSIPYEVVCQKYKYISKPCDFFSLSDRDYYHMIAKIAVQEPTINFSRVYFDRPNTAVDFESIFGPERAPMLGSPDVDLSLDAPELYPPISQYYLNLWKSGDVDLIVTRFSSLEPYFKQQGIRYQFLLASKHSILETFQRLLLQLNAHNAHDSATCIGLVTVRGTLTQKRRNILTTRIQSLNHSKGMPFLIYERNDQLELTTNVSLLKELSSQFTACPITACLDGALDVPVYVGWGCANHIMDAYQNARRALRAAKGEDRSGAYIVTADNVIIGPLSSLRRITFADIPNEALTQLSRQLSLSPLYISKISAVLSQKESNTLSAEELAFFLNITTRSASRILNKLVDGGVASVGYNRQLNLRGRPAKIYEIHLDQAALSPPPEGA